ncbi:hypothetical protein B0H13DRAFT_1900013 [Mycena leptocephala]|nr:hypothetical protein B0H13DRAFT_1900013 [Mycena leptocephala]
MVSLACAGPPGAGHRIAMQKLEFDPYPKFTENKEWAWVARSIFVERKDVETRRTQMFVFVPAWTFREPNGQLQLQDSLPSEAGSKAGASGADVPPTSKQGATSGVGVNICKEHSGLGVIAGAWQIHSKLVDHYIQGVVGQYSEKHTKKGSAHPIKRHPFLPAHETAFKTHAVHYDFRKLHKIIPNFIGGAIPQPFHDVLFDTG